MLSALELLLRETIVSGIFASISIVPMAPSMNSSSQSAIESATRTNNIMFLAYIAVLILTALTVALFTYLTWRTGNAVQTAIVSDANARIEEAKKKAAEAEQHAGELEKSNLTLRGQVAGLETKAASAQKDVAALQKNVLDAKASQQQVEIELSKQQERTAIAERGLSDLKLALRPRRLSEIQQRQLILLLSGTPKGPVSISCVIGDGEGQAFAMDIYRALRAAGWTIDGDGVTQAAYTGDPVGLGLLVHSAATAPAYAIRLQRAFFSIGIPLEGAQVSNIPEGKVSIVVGHKAPVQP